MVNGEPGPTRAYRRQVVDRPAIQQVDMVKEVRLNIKEEPTVGNGMVVNVLEAPFSRATIIARQSWSGSRA